MLSEFQFRLFSLEIPTIEFFDEFDEEKCRFSVEDFLHWSKGKFSVDLRIAVCSMCGGEKNEVETFLDQLSSRLTLTPIGASSLFFSAFVGRKKRKVCRRDENFSFFRTKNFSFQVELNFVSFHSLLNSKVSEFDGFILLYDRDRAAAVRTMKFGKKTKRKFSLKQIFSLRFLEKNISNNLKNEFEENRQIPIYLLSSTGDVPTQRQKGTIKTFLESSRNFSAEKLFFQRNFSFSELFPFSSSMFDEFQRSDDRRRFQVEQIFIPKTFSEENFLFPFFQSERRIDKFRSFNDDQRRPTPLAERFNKQIERSFAATSSFRSQTVERRTK